MSSHDVEDVIAPKRTEPTRIDRVLSVIAAIVVPVGIQAGAAWCWTGPGRSISFPYDFYLAWSLLLAGPLIGFYFIWRQFRGFFVLLVVTFVLYYPTMMILMIYVAFAIAQPRAGDLP
jgi:hypothetical protein